MKINFKATNLQIPQETTNYCYEKLTGLDKMLSRDESTSMNVELGKTTQHHRQGEVFRAEMNLHTAGKNFRAEAIENDLYAAIDKARDELLSEVRRYRRRQETLIRRGGRTVKDFLRGIYNYKWRRK